LQFSPSYPFSFPDSAVEKEEGGKMFLISEAEVIKRD
jgi:hypothetical protein